MHVTIYLTDGSTLEWADLPTWDLAALQGALMGDDVPAFVQMTMDDTTVLISTEHIVRVDVEGL